MILRSRKSIAPRGSVEEKERDETAARRRRSTRLRGRATYEDSDESEPESVLSRAMESDRSVPEPEELEEEVAEEADKTVLKYCTVTLDRLRADNKAAKRELEEMEEMNRRGGKLASKIPTFHKRPNNASHNNELLGAKKDTSMHVVQPYEKAASVSMVPLMSKQTDVREKGLPLPLTRIPKIDFDAFSLSSRLDQAAHSARVTPPRTFSFSESLQHSLFTASPRPALRAEQGDHYLEQDESKTADTLIDGSLSHRPFGVRLPHKPQEDTPQSFDFEVNDLRDTVECNSAETAYTAGNIIHEEPPWESEPTASFVLKDCSSSSDSDCENVLEVKEPEARDLQENKHYKSHRNQPEHGGRNTCQQVKANEFTSLEPPKRPFQATASELASGSCTASFFVFFLLPATLLLLGGQHVWRYGLPGSVVQLSTQLELHWLEGLGLGREPCSVDCRVSLVESVPMGLYTSTRSPLPSITDSWLRLLDKADRSVHIAAFYLTLQDSDSTSVQGKQVFEKLKKLKSKGVKLHIAVNSPQASTQDTDELSAAGAVIKEVNLKAVTGGVLHTKLWVVDQEHLYLGSANMDWRSLSQVKEVGLSVENCSCLAQDAFRIFGVYWRLSGNSLPLYWPARLSALSSSYSPLHVNLNGVPARVYLSSSPPQISARGRSDDLATILSVIHDAQEFISISVMDYLPMSQFTEPIRFWPAIDSALRAAACTRQVKLRILVSCWDHSPTSMFPFLQSLLILSREPLACDIEVKIFTVPSTKEQSKIPFARVNHAKFMVTDRVVYIGTSNWSENYFTQTAGVGLMVNQTGSVVEEAQQTLQSQAEELFLRDWRSDYAKFLTVNDVNVCRRNIR